MPLNAVCLALLATAAAIPAASQSTPRAASPAPLGKLVDIGGHRVHLYCTGQGNPIVVVVGAGFSFDWGLVQPDISKLTTICTYDVSGTAWSDPGPNLTCRDRTNEVHQMLGNAGLKGPFVLVGLSVGGLVARLYASQFPGEVSGLVIVDHAFNPADYRPARAAAPIDMSAADTPPVLLSTTPINLTLEDMPVFSKLPELNQRLHRWAVSRDPAPDAAQTADDCVVQLKNVPLKKANLGSHPLGDLPLAVVSTANDTHGYKQLQAELLSLSRASRQWMAPQSFHSVEVEQPEVVIDAIRNVVESVRKGAPTDRR